MYSRRITHLELIIAANTGDDACTETLRATHANAADKAAYTDVRQHASFAPARRHDRSKNDCSSDDNRAIRKKTRSEKKLFEASNRDDALLSRAV